MISSVSVLISAVRLASWGVIHLDDIIGEAFDVIGFGIKFDFFILVLSKSAGLVIEDSISDGSGNAI